MEAARQLFAAHGYEATTTVQIARAAQVAERTLYRYFDGKEELVAEELLARIELLRGAIGARPGAEPPLTAVRRAMLAVAREGQLWPLASASMPLSQLRRSTPRPLRRLEEAIAGAVLDRLRAGADPLRTGAAAQAEAELTAEVVARVAVSPLRTATIRHRQLRARGQA